MSRIKVGQIGIGHEHASGKMEALRRLSELYEVVGIVEEQTPDWPSSKAYEGLERMTEDRLLSTPGDAAIPVANFHPQVTCALYRTACHSALEGMLDAGQGKLRKLLDRIDPTMVGPETWSQWGEDGSSWLSLDTPEALRAAEARR